MSEQLCSKCAKPVKRLSFRKLYSGLRHKYLVRRARKRVEYISFLAKELEDRKAVLTHDPHFVGALLDRDNFEPEDNRVDQVMERA